MNLSKLCMPSWHHCKWIKMPTMLKFFHFKFKAWNFQKLTSKICNIRNLAWSNSTIVVVISIHSCIAIWWNNDNFVFTKKWWFSFIKVTTPHKKSSLLGAKGGGFSSCMGFKYLETFTKRHQHLLIILFHNCLLFYPCPHIQMMHYMLPLNLGSSWRPHKQVWNNSI